MNRMWKGQAFTVCHADDGKFEGRGLRAFFEYRQLGISEATGGKFGAHVIRAKTRRARRSCAREAACCSPPASAIARSPTPTTWS
jgi:hypothetical protein